ncbi:MAG: DUF4433 domain-containing protein [Victivallaceae bacterium]|jgi:hypothetical protein
MMPPNPLQIPLYHITHIDNLPSILAAGGLWCDCERLRQGFRSINIAHPELKLRRMGTPVGLYPGKKIGDFVPFYFANRSPMLYSIHTGFVNGYAGGQGAVVYLVTDVGRLLKCGNNWCFSDGHAVEAFSGFYNELNDLDKIDWPLIGNWSWKNTLEDNDRKRRKQAEFLVEGSVPLSAVSHIAAMNAAAQAQVAGILNNSTIPLAVTIEPDWYY